MLKALFAPIARGNAHRVEKYGREDSFTESWRKGREAARRRKDLQHPTPERHWPMSDEAVLAAENVDQFKESFEFWDEWTGARYVRAKNPDPKSWTKSGTVCRSCSVTGEWKAYA